MLNLVEVVKVNGDKILVNPTSIVTVSDSRVPTEAVVSLADGGKITITKSELDRLLKGETDVILS